MGDATRWEREPGRGRYAHPERERRFLVEGDVPAGQAARLVEDRYLDGTRLRLRHVSGEGRSVYKLTQKVRPDESDPSEVLVTNLYLSQEEHARLAVLPGALVVKTRRVVTHAGRDFAVDAFSGPLRGLRLAEVELQDLGDAVALPAWVGREVTHDDRFSGGRLALLGAQDLVALIGA